jgi:hypothetical protein
MAAQKSKKAWHFTRQPASARSGDVHFSCTINPLSEKEELARNLLRLGKQKPSRKQ